MSQSSPSEGTISDLAILLAAAYLRLLAERAGKNGNVTPLRTVAAGPAGQNCLDVAAQQRELVDG